MPESTGSASFKVDSPEFIESIRPLWPEFGNDYSYYSYVSLYLFAVSFCKNKKVLDAACGIGFGSYLLAQKARFVTGIDIDRSSLAHAKKHYHNDRLSFELKDATDTGFPSQFFDVITSIETFEHIPKELADKFIGELKRLLKPEGLLIISTPNHDVYSRISHTKGHVNELNVDDFFAHLSKYFAHCQAYYQRKGALESMKGFYATVRADKYKLRRFIPEVVKKSFKRLMAPDLQKGSTKLLDDLKVRHGEILDDLKNAVIQVAVCRT